MTKEIALSIEETNRLRASIGLPLIPTDNEGSDSRKPDTGEGSTTKTQGVSSMSSARHQLSVEETNKLRLSLGLKPIPQTDAADSELPHKTDRGDQANIDRDDQAGARIENLKRRDIESRDEEADAAAGARIESLKRKRADHKAAKRQKVSPLWDDIDDEAWLVNLGKKSEKKDPGKKKTEDPSKEDTTGLAFGHSMKELATIDKDQIFTLKDTDILNSDDSPDDELENEDLTKSETVRRELKEKQRMNDAIYNNVHNRFDNSSHDDEQEDDPDTKRVILTGSTLAFPERTANDSTNKDEKPLHSNSVKLSGLFDDLDEDTAIDTVGLDYSKPKKSVKMKKISKSSKSKSKSKSTSSSRSKPEDDIDSSIGLREVPLEIDEPGHEDENDELQQLLDLKRRQKQQQARANLTPEQIAQEVRRNAQWEATHEAEQRGQVGASLLGGQLYDDTTDFLNSLGVDTPRMEVNLGSEADTKVKQESDEVQVKQEEGEVQVKQEEDEVQVKQEEDEVHVKQEDDKEESKPAVQVKQEEGVNLEVKQESVNGEADPYPFQVNEERTTEVEQYEHKRNQGGDASKADNTQPSFSSTGLASTLQYLHSHNIVSRPTTEQDESAKRQRQAAKEAELLKIQLSIEERVVREELEADKKFMNLPREQREQQIQDHVDHRLRERGVLPEVPIMVDKGPARRYNKYKSFNPKSSKSTDRLAGFNPQVKLEYRDEDGNDLNTKEAFKYLSHRFHGVGPGKAKVEKRLRKQQEARSLSEANNERIL